MDVIVMKMIDYQVFQCYNFKTVLYLVNWIGLFKEVALWLTQ